VVNVAITEASSQLKKKLPCEVLGAVMF